MATLGPHFVLGKPQTVAGRAHPQSALWRRAAGAPETFVNLLPEDAAAFDVRGNWKPLGNWEISNGVASNPNADTAQNLEYNLAVPAGDMWLSFKMTASNDTGGVLAQFGGGFLNLNQQRRDVGQHGWLLQSNGHTRLRLIAEQNWAGSIDDVEMYDLNAVQDRPADVYLLGGQSNMAGNSARPVDPQLDAGHPLITYLPSYEATRFGSETDALTIACDPLQHDELVIGVGPGLAAAKGMLSSLASGRRIVLVAAAKGGTGLVASNSEWHPGTGTNYTKLVSRAEAALALLPAGSAIKGLFWSQGETDNGVSVDTTYPPVFRAFLSELKTDLELSDLPTVILGPTPEADPDGRLAAAQATLDERSGDANATAGVRFVAGPTGHASPGDEVHFTPAGNRIRGATAAVAMRSLLSAIAVFSLTYGGSPVTYNNSPLTYSEV